MNDEQAPQHSGRTLLFAAAPAVDYNHATQRSSSSSLRITAQSRSRALRPRRLPASPNPSSRTVGSPSLCRNYHHVLLGRPPLDNQGVRSPALGTSQDIPRLLAEARPLPERQPRGTVHAATAFRRTLKLHSVRSKRASFQLPVNQPIVVINTMATDAARARQ